MEQQRNYANKGIKRKQIKVNLLPDDYQKLKLYCEHIGYSISKYVNSMILRDLKYPHIQVNKKGSGN